MMDIDGMDSEEEQPNIKEEQYHPDGKKMTDEEKRKNFLERNRYVTMFDLQLQPSNTIVGWQR